MICKGDFCNSKVKEKDDLCNDCETELKVLIENNKYKRSGISSARGDAT